MNRVPGLAPRFAAWRILHDVRHGVPFDTALDRAVAQLEPDDRRLTHELAAGVFRQRAALDRTLAAAVTRGLRSVRPDTLDVLRLGAFQLASLDRVPAHAAVQTTVDVARRLGGERVAGFVNAVLRRIARPDQPDSPDANEDPAAALAAEGSHPEWLVRRWLTRFGANGTQRLLAWNNTRPGLTIQPARWNSEDLTSRLDAAGIEHRPAPFGAGIRVEARRPTDLPGFREGGFLVQDPAQRLIARFLDPGPVPVLYDACASPGGKTVALGESAALTVAADRSRARVAKLAETVERAGSDRIVVIQADARRPPLARADAVLLDVPCLGTGTFARNPDARWRVTAEALGGLVRQAAAFLDAAAGTVAPGGLLLFATCSLEPEENAVQVDEFLRRNPRFRREPSPAAVPELLTPEGDLELLPQRTATDGGFAARLRAD